MLYFVLFCIFFGLVVVQFGLQLLSDLGALDTKGWKRSNVHEGERQPLLFDHKDEGETILPKASPNVRCTLMWCIRMAQS